MGIVSYREGKSFVMADIPGIIEGASEGKGLGLRFLRHIERNSLLLFMVPGDTDDIRKEYEILLNELATFNPEMLDKQRVLAITKSDMLDEELIAMLEPTLPDNVPHIFISSVTGLGIQQLKDILWTELNKDSNKLEGVRTETIVHRAKDVAKLQEELKDMGEDEDFEYKYEEDADDDFDYEYEDEDWARRRGKEMKWLTSDNKMLGYGLMKAYPNILVFLLPVMEGAAREIMLLLIAPDIVGMSRACAEKLVKYCVNFCHRNLLELIIPHQNRTAPISV